MKVRFLTAAVLLGLILAGHAIGQNVNASIGGIVQDATKALIPGATVKAKNTNTGVELTALTNETGAYNFPSVLPVTYEVSAELSGFKPTTYKGVEVGLAQVRLD